MPSENLAGTFAGQPAGTAMNLLSDIIREVVSASGGTYEEAHFRQPIMGFVSTLYTDAWVTAVEFSLLTLAEVMAQKDPEHGTEIREEVTRQVGDIKSSFANAGWMPGLPDTCSVPVS